MLAWQLIGAPLADATAAFTTSGGIMQVHRTPLTFPIFLHALRTLVNFGAQLITAIVVLLVTRLLPVPHWGLLPGIALDLYTTFMLSLLIAIPSTRYRDLAQIVSMLVACCSSLRGVLEHGPDVGEPARGGLAKSARHELELIRKPLMGLAPSISDWAWALGTAGAATVLAFLALAFFRKRVIFWL